MMKESHLEMTMSALWIQISQARIAVQSAQFRLILLEVVMRLDPNKYHSIYKCYTS